MRKLVGPTEKFLEIKRAVVADECHSEYIVPVGSFFGNHSHGTRNRAPITIQTYCERSFTASLFTVVSIIIIINTIIRRCID